MVWEIVVQMRFCDGELCPLLRQLCKDIVLVPVPKFEKKSKEKGRILVAESTFERWILQSKRLFPGPEINGGTYMR